MGKSILEAMTSNPCAIEADRSVSYAAKMLKQEDVGLAPIVENGRLVGVVAQADVAEEAKPKKTGQLVGEISKD